jgi:hypothetical protein
MKLITSIYCPGYKSRSLVPADPTSSWHGAKHGDNFTESLHGMVINMGITLLKACNTNSVTTMPVENVFKIVVCDSLKLLHC